MLQKVKIFTLLITFTFLSVSFVFLYGGNLRVYASNGSTIEVNCGNLSNAVIYFLSNSHATTDPNSIPIVGSQKTLSVTVLKQNKSPFGTKASVYIWKAGLFGGGIHCSPGPTTTNEVSSSENVRFPNGITKLYYYFPTGNYLAIIYAPPTSKPLSACGSSSGSSYASCVSCLSKNSNNVYTDFGCVTATPAGFIKFIYAFLLTIAVMIDLVIFIVSGYLIMTSNGDPDKINRGKSLFKNAIIGLILIIFAIVLLQLIGSIFGISQL